MAVVIVQGIADDLFVIAEVDHRQPFAFVAAHEAVVTGAVDLEFFVRLEDGPAVLFPGTGIEQVVIVVGAQHSHAVARARRRSGVGHVDLSLGLGTVEDGGTFVDPEAAVALPVVVGGADAHEFGLEFGGRFELRHEQVGDGRIGALAAEFLRPDGVPSALHLKHRHVEREVGEGIGVVLGGLHGDGVRLPFVRHGVLSLADERVGADVPDVGIVTCGKVDDPLAHDVVQFGRPDVRCELARLMLFPDDAALGGCDAVDRVGAADLKAVVERTGRRKIIFSVAFAEIGVCALGRKG